MKTNPLFLLAFLSLFLSGCLDEGGSSKKPDRAETPPATSNPEEPQPDESGPETPPVAPPLDPQPKPDDGNTTAPAPGFPEPTGAVLEEVNAEGFYDIDASGKPRAVRNDLNGNLPAMVQFVQNHSVDPSGNAAKNMPMLTSEREALLLVTPDPAGGTVRSLTLSFSVDGQTKPAIALRHPDELPEADRNSSDTRPDVRYSRRAWSAVLPWDWVKPGMSLSISDDRGRNGVLAGGAIDIAAPAELVINNVRLGLLTEPPRSNGHHMLLEPARAGTDYFQTVPVSRLIVAKYDEVILQKVMVAITRATAPT
ncbi:M66 family metalloprotease [Stutzerimonas nitrititolerans]|uniref:M66 family metalloprotease n=1 Tax=Stutzerimonas nitrititolerans TaxID=2482751 RepID=UPI002899095F|nr:M66 family metalloprotease [Stutzerimonas nitrititolerans]